MIARSAWMRKHRAWIPAILCLLATGSFFLPWMAPPMQQKPVYAEVGYPPANMYPPYVYQERVTWNGWDIVRNTHDDYLDQIKRDLFPRDPTLVWPDTQTRIPLSIFPALLLFLYTWYTPIRFLRALLLRVSIGVFLFSIIAIMSIKFSARLTFDTAPYAHTTFFYRSTLTYGAYSTSMLLLTLLVLQFEALGD
jgi:hypothetical protein